jgi:ferrous iron transport protein A
VEFIQNPACSWKIGIGSIAWRKHVPRVKTTAGKHESKVKTLKDTPIGQTVRVKKLHGKGPLRRRIMDMGITKGVDIYVRKMAPLGDPMEVTVRGYELSLRKSEAEQIEVE